MLICAVVITLMRNLFAGAILLSIYSLLASTFFMTMDAVDVAFTEAAVGAGISTILVLATLLHVGHDTKPAKTLRVLPLLVTVFVAGLLIYGLHDMPGFGQANNPVHTHPIAEYYIENSESDTKSPNMVTAILASYRGYDTLGEVTVVFTAGIGVLLLLGGRRKNNKRKADPKIS